MKILIMKCVVMITSTIIMVTVMLMNNDNDACMFIRHDHSYGNQYRQ